MHLATFLLLLVTFFVLIGVVVWTIKNAQSKQPRQEAASQEEKSGPIPSEPDEAIKWLEDLAERQANSGKKRVH